MDPSVAIRLVDIFEGTDHASDVQAHLSSQHSSAVAALIRHVRTPPLCISSVKLLRALWCSAPLRPIILTTFASTAPPEVSNEDDELQNCLHELAHYLSLMTHIYTLVSNSPPLHGTSRSVQRGESESSDESDVVNTRYMCGTGRCVLGEVCIFGAVVSRQVRSGACNDSHESVCV